MKFHRKAFLGIICLIVALLLQGCANNTTPQDTTLQDTAADTPVAVPVQDLSVVADGASEYAVVIAESARDEINRAARVVLDAIAEKTGAKLTYKDDFLERDESVAKREILVGLTQRGESADVMQELRYGEYAIRVVGEKIVIAAWDDESLLQACEAFAALVEESGTEGQLTVAHDYAVKAESFAALLEMPLYGDEEDVQFVDLADECYMLYADDTDEAEFREYFTALEEAGYTQFATRQMANNLYATYVSDTKVIHASYWANDKDAHIAIEDVYDMSLFVKSEYEKICAPTVTLVGLENYGKNAETGIYNQIGLSMVFRLEDGRFVVVDGGGHSKTAGESIYNTLRKQAVDKKNITVAAWIFTHAHGDHTGGFVKFTAANYHDNVKVENFVYHFSTAEQYEGIDEGADEGRATEVRNLIAVEYPQANVIKAHTGQLLQVGGAEIEMLYTFADLEPTHLEYHNTTSLVFRISTGGSTVMVLGDASTRTNPFIVREYGDYLKSDMVQIAHHGRKGGTVEVYEAIDADIVLFPTGVASIDGTHGDCTVREYNAKAIELAEEVYVAGKKAHTIVMPYTPGDHDTPKFYT